MILMAGLDLPLTAIREQIAASVDIVVQQARLADGRRVVTAIVEVTGMESGRIQLQELFRFDRELGFVGCGVFLSFADTWREAGIRLESAQFCGQTTVSGPMGKATAFLSDNLAQGGIL